MNQAREEGEFGDDEHLEDLDEINEILPSNYSITSYGADYPVDGLVKRLTQGDIIVPLFSNDKDEAQSTVGFQREFVWTKPQADKFIESLLLGFPVPGIFLVKERSGKHLVLDGQQRLKTLEGFYLGIFLGKEFLLDNVQTQWQGKSYANLDPEDRRRLDDSIIHATIVRQDEPSEDQSSIYLIFERLNSGGTFLQPQEIRVALYHGQFAAALSQLNESDKWRELYGKKSRRLKDIELILRFFALYFYAHSYQRPMKEFLNKYMAANKDLEKQSEGELADLFNSTVETILENIGARAFRLRNAVNAAVLDSLMVGVARRLSTGEIHEPEKLRDAYDELMNNEDYLGAVTRATADEENVSTRLAEATKAFEGLK